MPQPESVTANTAWPSASRTLSSIWSSGASMRDGVLKQRVQGRGETVVVAGDGRLG